MHGTSIATAFMLQNKEVSTMRARWSRVREHPSISTSSAPQARDNCRSAEDARKSHLHIATNSDVYASQASFNNGRLPGE